MGIGPYRDLFLKNSAPVVLGKMENFVPEATNSFFASNLASAPTFKVVSLADDNNSASGYDSKEMKIMGLLSIIFLIGVSIFCNRRRSTVEEGNRASRQEGAHKNGKGLERSVIESFPVFSYNLVKGLKAQAMGSECAVCLSDFGDEEMVRLLPKCSHAFHPECIDMWLCSNTTCPICRVSLTPAEDSIPTATAEPRTTPEQVTIVVDNGNNEAPETSNDSTEHLLVMVQPTEWCIATPRGLTPGLHRSCSFTANHHCRAPSTSNAGPVSSKTGCSVDDVGRRSKSKRWGNISMKSGSFFRSFTEQRSHNVRASRTLSWVTVGEGEMNRAEGTEMGSTSSGHAIQFTEKSSVLSSEKVKGILRYKSF